MRLPEHGAQQDRLCRRDVFPGHRERLPRCGLRDFSLGAGQDGKDGRACTEDETSYFGELPEVGLEIMMKVGNFETAVSFGQLCNAGVSLTRLELLIHNATRLHPKALLN